MRLLFSLLGESGKMPPVNLLPCRITRLGSLLLFIFAKSERAYFVKFGQKIRYQNFAKIVKIVISINKQFAQLT